MSGMGRRALTVLLCLCFLLGGFAPRSASAETLIEKVLATTSYTPVALMNAGDITAASSTAGVYLSEYGWYNENGTRVTDKFGVRPVTVSMTFVALNGYRFSDTVRAYLNNGMAGFTLSPDMRTLTLKRTYEPMIWAPSVIKNPGDEYLREGGVASFVAAASYTEGFQWYACDPGSDTTQSIYAIPNGIDVISDGQTSKLIIYGVPAWMDGWQVFCSFVGALGSKSDSTRATLHVEAVNPPAEALSEDEEEPEETPEETPEPTPAPTPEPTPEPTPAPTPDPTPAPTPEPAHVHVFSEAWFRDGEKHWRECACGEIIEQGAHTMTWKTERRATRAKPGLELGVCSVCGFESERPLAYTGPSPALSLAIIGVGGLVGLTVLTLIVDSIVRAVKRRRKK